MTVRRELVLVVACCAAGAALALVAAGRTWAEELTPQPAPLPDLRTGQRGSDRLPWLPALAWVAVAGAGALLATQGMLRRAVGGLLVLAGGVVAVGAGIAAAQPGTGPGWPVAAGLGGLAVGVAGAVGLGRGHRWPAMGARYERGAAAPRRAREEPPPERLWEALDRGEDPTA